jgi:Zn-dependent protease with chaperone function
MNHGDYEGLVRRVEARYAGREQALRRATAAWAALGLAGILAWVGLLLLAGGAMLAAGAMLPAPGGVLLLLLVAGSLLIAFGLAQAALFFRSDPARPEGRAIAPGEAPALRELLAALPRELGGRPFEEIRFTSDFNAGVRDISRFGIAGWSRASLELGLPLLAALAPGELRAVLAHEFAHRIARHRRGHYLYRVHRSWQVIFERFGDPPQGGMDRLARGAVAGFVKWYWPRFHARGFVLSRAQEYEADRLAAGVAGGEALAWGLWRTECFGQLLGEKFWPDLWKRASEAPEPPEDILEAMRAALSSLPAPADAARWAGAALARVTDYQDTHPAFSDRARSVGVSAEDFRRRGFPAPAGPSAAEAFLGADLPDISADLAARWRGEVLATWHERHRRASTHSRRGARLDAGVGPAPAAGPSDLAALWNAAREADANLGPASAEPLLRRLLEAEPGHRGASVLLGRHLLADGREGGERLLWDVFRGDDVQWTPWAGEVLAEHFRATGQAERLREVRAGLDRYEAAFDASRRERASVTHRDPLLHHGLTDESLGRLRALLDGQPDCHRAWLVRKDLRHFPDRPLFILCVGGSPARRWRGDPDGDRRLATRLAPLISLPGQQLVVANQGGFRPLARALMSRPDALVYAREGRGSGA